MNFEALRGLERLHRQKEELREIRVIRGFFRVLRGVLMLTLACVFEIFRREQISLQSSLCTQTPSR